MKKMLSAILIIACAVICIGPASSWAASKEEEKIDDAVEVMNQTMSIPERGIPEEILTNAQGIAIIPGVIKAGFIVGGRYGTGVMVIRDAEGAWSRPAFITIAGGSIGWQVGVQSIDIILVFKSRRGVENMMKGKITLGLDAGIAAGPVGRRLEAGTDVKLKAEIVSYSRSRGLFAGISIEGATLEVDDAADERFYGPKTSQVKDVFTSKELTTPESAEKLRDVLKKYTSAMETPAGGAKVKGEPVKKEEPAKEEPPKEEPIKEEPVKEEPVKESPQSE